jgi:hypothetical protein
MFIGHTPSIGIKLRQERHMIGLNMSLRRSLSLESSVFYRHLAPDGAMAGRTFIA